MYLAANKATTVRCLRYNVSHEEITTRSSIGMNLFSPPGENERLINRKQDACTDTTARMAVLRRCQSTESRTLRLVVTQASCLILSSRLPACSFCAGFKLLEVRDTTASAARFPSAGMMPGAGGNQSW